MRPVIAFLVCIAVVPAAELTVGPGKTYAVPSAAAAVAVDGDTISIDAGTYTGDVCAWTQSNLTLRGVGGMAHLAADGHYAWGKGTWVLAGNDCTVENIEFSGAAVPDKNGAGIRLDGSGLTVRNCWFHDNEDGILTAAGGSSDVLIENCEFGYNGAGDGYSHNLYIGHIRSLTFRYNYSHHAKIGHNFKSRASANYIVGNRIMDEAAGTSSYVVDVPNGGLTFLIGNLIQQGPATSNHSAIIRYGEEGGSNPVQHLYAINNTVVNDYAGSTTFLDIAASTTVARVENNIFLGTGTAIGGTPTSNLHNLATTTDPLVGRATYDYHLADGAAAIDAGADPGSAESQALLPVVQYVHPHASEGRSTSGSTPDIGAYEHGGGAPANTAPSVTATSATPTTVTGTTTAIAATASDDGGEGALTYTWSASGPAAVAFSPNRSNAAKAATATFSRVGSYTLTVTARDAGSLTATGTVAVTVSATPTTVAVSPATATVAVGHQRTFLASARDQFGAALAVPPVATWSVDAGGTIDAGGIFTATVAGGPYTVTATVGALHHDAIVTVDPAGSGTSVSSGTASHSGCGSGNAGLMLLIGLPFLVRRRGQWA